MTCERGVCSAVLRGKTSAAPEGSVCHEQCWVSLIPPPLSDACSPRSSCCEHRAPHSQPSHRYLPRLPQRPVNRDGLRKICPCSIRPTFARQPLCFPFLSFSPAFRGCCADTAKLWSSYRVFLPIAPLNISWRATGCISRRGSGWCRGSSEMIAAGRKLCEDELAAN